MDKENLFLYGDELIKDINDLSDEEKALYKKLLKNLGVSISIKEFMYEIYKKYFALRREINEGEIRTAFKKRVDALIEYTDRFIRENNDDVNLYKKLFKIASSIWSRYEDEYQIQKEIEKIDQIYCYDKNNEYQKLRKQLEAQLNEETMRFLFFGIDAELLNDNRKNKINQLPIFSRKNMLILKELIDITDAKLVLMHSQIERQGEKERINEYIYTEFEEYRLELFDKISIGTNNQGNEIKSYLEANNYQLCDYCILGNDNTLGFQMNGDTSHFVVLKNNVEISEKEMDCVIKILLPEN